MAPSIPRSPSTSVSSFPSTNLSGIELEKPIALAIRQRSNRAFSPGEAEQAGCIKKARTRRAVAMARPAVKMLIAADKVSFKDMVHAFTGQKVVAKAHCYSSAREAVLVAALAESVRAVDTIAALLLGRGSDKELLRMQYEIEKALIVEELKHRHRADEYTRQR